MKLFVFSLQDQKTGIFHAPIFFAHKALGMRAAVDLGGDLSTSVGRHPYDYGLHCLGSFDDATGEFTRDGYEYFGTVGAVLVASERSYSVDPATATASEIVAAREAGEL